MKLNLGAGGTRIDGFASVDVDSQFEQDLVGDFRRMQFSGVEEIYASHILEHFFYGEAEQILRLWAGWLKPGGILWIAVPAFVEIVHLYAAGEISPHLLGLLYGADAKPEWAHHSGWTEAHLISVLEGAGFAVLGKFESFVKNAAQNGADWSGAWHRTAGGGIVQLSLNLKARRVPS